jgi:hypothetical protein
MKTTKEIYEKAFVKDRLFWINNTDDNKDVICSMDNNPKNDVKWFSVYDVEQLQKQNVSDTQRLLSEIQKELKDKLLFTADKVEHYKNANSERIIGIYALFFEYNKQIDEVFNNFKGGI